MQGKHLTKAIFFLNDNSKLFFFVGKTYMNMTNVIYNKPSANTIVTNEKLKSVSLIWGMGVTSLTTPVYKILEILDRVVQD